MAAGGPGRPWHVAVALVALAPFVNAWMAGRMLIEADDVAGALAVLVMAVGAVCALQVLFSAWQGGPPAAVAVYYLLVGGALATFYGFLRVESVPLTLGLAMLGLAVYSAVAAAPRTPRPRARR